DGKRNLPPPPGLTMVGDETSGYGIEKNNELRQQQKPVHRDLRMQPGGLFPLRNLMPSYATIFRWFKDASFRSFVKV
ncbi:MAG: hypothetical protein J7J76_02585, partial [Candidatus Latescibacteria bacterium]|nr:hypothetical protein [Candidatus Latescibacterota bacterium]